MESAQALGIPLRCVQSDIHDPGDVAAGTPQSRELFGGSALFDGVAEIDMMDMLPCMRTATASPRRSPSGTHEEAVQAVLGFLTMNRAVFLALAHVVYQIRIWRESTRLSYS